MSKLLTPGGVFLATTVDCRVLTHMALESSMGPTATTTTTKTTTTTSSSSSSSSVTPLSQHEQHAIQISNQFNQQLLKITFDQTNWNKLVSNPVQLGRDLANRTDEEAEIEELTHKQAFGIKYNFLLMDNEDEASAVDAPEWIVPLGTPLEALLANYDLEIKYECNFHQFVHDNMEKNKELWDRMEVLYINHIVCYTIIVLFKHVSHTIYCNFN